MTKTVPLKNSTAVAVVQSPKLPAPKPQREYGDFDAFVANGDEMVAFFQRIDGYLDRLDFDKRFEWLDKPDHYGIDLERTKQEIASAKYGVESARHALSQLPWARKGLAAFKRDLKWYDRKELYDIKGKGKHQQRTLSRRVVSEQIGLLLASFQNSRPGTPKVFGKMVVEEVYANNPNACVLESACRRVRREKDFPPSIAEVLKAIKSEGSAWCDRWELEESDADYMQDRLQTAIAEAESTIAKAEAKLVEREAKAKADDERRERERQERLAREQREREERKAKALREAYEQGEFDARYSPERWSVVKYIDIGGKFFDAYLAGVAGKPIPGPEIMTN